MSIKNQIMKDMKLRLKLVPTIGLIIGAIISLIVKDSQIFLYFLLTIGGWAWCWLMTYWWIKDTKSPT